MNSMHDLGGMDGHGPIEPKQNGLVFHDDGKNAYLVCLWRVLRAVTLMLMNSVTPVNE